MTATRRKQIIIGGITVLVIAFIVYGFFPDPIAVQTATVERAPMQVTVEEEGVTRVVDRYTVSSTATAWMRRIPLEPGDHVEQGDVLVQLEPPPSAPLDPRSRAQAEARLEGAQAALRRAERAHDAAIASARQAESERQRVERLLELGSATNQMKEQAESAAATAKANQEAAEAAVTAAQADVRAARVTLEPSSDTALDVAVSLRAPAAGKILAIHRQSEGMISPGMTLLEIGDTDALEVRSDVLSQDAVLMGPGTRVLFDQWGGDDVLEGVVERVEPEGFTSVSSLGVEEQRVNVISTITSALDARSGLGSGFRVQARFIVWQDDDVLQVPSSALFRTDDGWAAFVVEDGRAVKKAVEVGQRTGLSAQIQSGIEEGTTVIVHPGNNVEDRIRVTERE